MRPSRVVCRRFARSVTEPGVLSNCIHASAASSPSRSSQRSASQRGCDSVTLRYASAVSRSAGSDGRGGRGSEARRREIDRSTAFTKPLALRFPAFFVRSTASSTTAAAGTRVRWSN